MTARWNGPVATTTLVASIVPSDVSARKPVPPALPAQRRHRDAGADGRGDPFGVADEIVDHLVAAGEAVRVDAGDRQAGQPVVPGGAVGVQAIPALRAPAFGDAVAFEDEVGEAALAQLLAHGQAGLAGADDERFDCFNRHGMTPVALARRSCRRDDSLQGAPPRLHALRKAARWFAARDGSPILALPPTSQGTRPCPTARSTSATSATPPGRCAAGWPCGWLGSMSPRW